MLRLTRHRAGKLNLSLLLPKDTRSGDSLVPIITVLTGSPSQRKEGKEIRMVFPGQCGSTPWSTAREGRKPGLWGRVQSGFSREICASLSWVVTFVNSSYPTWKMGVSQQLLPMLVCSGLGNETPQTGGSDNRNVSSHSSRGWKSKIKVSARVGPFCGP